MLFYPSSHPRRFHHEYMYVDERKAFLHDLEQRAQHQPDGESGPEAASREALQRRIRGSLKPGLLRRRHNRYTAMWTSLILSAGVIALLTLLLFIF